MSGTHEAWLRDAMAGLDNLARLTEEHKRYRMALEQVAANERWVQAGPLIDIAREALGEEK